MSRKRDAGKKHGDVVEERCGRGTGEGRGRGMGKRKAGIRTGTRKETWTIPSKKPVRTAEMEFKPNIQTTAV
jgi:hypothetical protein